MIHLHIMICHRTMFHLPTMSLLLTIVLLTLGVSSQNSYGDLSKSRGSLRSSIVTGRGFATPPKLQSESYHGRKNNKKRQSSSSYSGQSTSSFPAPKQGPNDWGVISNPYKGVGSQTSNSASKEDVNWEELDLDRIRRRQRGKGKVEAWQQLGSIVHPAVQVTNVHSGYRGGRPQVQLDSVSTRQEEGSFNPTNHWFGAPGGDTALIHNNVVKYVSNFKKDPVILSRLSPKEKHLSSSESFSPASDWFGDKEEGLLEVPFDVPRRKRGHDIRLTHVSQEEENNASFSPNNDWLALRSNRIHGARQLDYNRQLSDEPEIITVDNVHRYIGDSNNNHNLNSNRGNSFTVSVAAGYSARGPKSTL